MTADRWEYLENHPMVTIAADGSFVPDSHVEPVQA